MTITVYRSTDDGAPALNGTAGSLIALLDACLVNGYGSKSPAGWTKEYSGTNLAAYRMSTVAPATGMYLRVNDTGTLDAIVVGYESMSGIDTGTNQFPRESQFSGGLYWAKSGNADSTPRPWMLVATNRSFYFSSNVASTSGNQGIVNTSDRSLFFGDIVSRKNVDGYECLIIGGFSSQANNTASTLPIMQSLTSNFAVLSGHYIARSYTGIGESTQVSKSRVYTQSLNSQYLGVTFNGSHPNSITNRIDFATVVIAESGVIFRGYLPGFYEIIGSGSNGYLQGTEIIGSGRMTGKTLVVINTQHGGNLGVCALQINGSWY